MKGFDMAQAQYDAAEPRENEAYDRWIEETGRPGSQDDWYDYLDLIEEMISYYDEEREYDY